MHCIDCGTEYEGKYCPKCGQPSKTGRITVKDALHSIFASFLMGDSKFIYTCLHLVWRPGRMVRDYIYGRRSKMMAPVPMLVRLVAVYLLISFIANIPVGDFNFVDEGVKENMHSQTLIWVVDILGRILENVVFRALALATICVAPFYLVFIKKKIERHDGTAAPMNMAEHFCAQVYIACQNMLMSFAILPFNGIEYNGIKSIFSLCTMVLNLLLLHQLYGMRWWKSIIYCLAAVVLSIAFVAFIVIFVYGLTYGIDNVR